MVRDVIFGFALFLSILLGFANIVKALRGQSIHWLSNVIMSVNISLVITHFLKIW